MKDHPFGPGEDKLSPGGFYEKLIQIQTILFDAHQSEDSFLRALELLGKSEDADRAYLCGRRTGTRYYYEFEWCAQGIAPGMKGVHEFDMEAYFPDWHQTLEAGEPINFTYTNGIYAPSSLGAELLETDSVKSVILVPVLQQNGSLMGFLGLDNPAEGDRDAAYLRAAAVTFSLCYSNRAYYREQIRLTAQQEKERAQRIYLEEKQIDEEVAASCYKEAAAIGVFDRNSGRLRFIKRMSELWSEEEMDKDAAVERFCAHFVSQQDRGYFLGRIAEEAVKEALAVHNEYVFRLRCRTHTGLRWTKWHIQAILSSHGRLLLINVLDIEEAVQKKQKRESLQNIAAALCAKYDSVTYLDLKTEIMYRANLKEGELVQGDRQKIAQLISRTVKAFVAEEYQKHLLELHSPQYILRLAEDGTQNLEYEYTIRRNGKDRWERLNVTMIRDEQASPFAAVYGYADITEEKEQEQRQIKEKAVQRFLNDAFDAVYLVNLTDDSYEIFRASEEVLAACRRYPNYSMLYNAALRRVQVLGGHEKVVDLSWLRRHIYDQGLQSEKTFCLGGDIYHRAFFIPYLIPGSQIPYLIVAEKDVTEEMRQELQSRQNKEILRQLSGEFTGIALLDLETGICENRGQSDIFGVKPGGVCLTEELAQRLNGTMAPEDVQRCVAFFDLETLKRGLFEKGENKELQVQLSRGPWVRLVFVPYRENDRFYSIIYGLDISTEMIRRRQLEENIQLLQQKRDFGNVLDALSEYYIAYYMVDERSGRTRPVKMPEPLQKLLHPYLESCYQTMEVYARELVSPAYRESLLQAMEDFRAGLKPNSKHKYVYQKKDGSWFALTLYKQAREDPQTIWIFERADEQERARQQMTLLNEQMLHIGQQLYRMEIFLDVEEDECRLLSFQNDALHNATGCYSRMIEKICARVQEPYRSRLLEKGGLGQIKEQISRGVKSDVIEYPVRRDDGTLRHLRSDIFVDMIQGKPYVLITVRDVTQEIRQREQEQAYQRSIQQALEAANAANEAKSAFLSDMSHDIRTPMNAIIGMTGIAQAYIAQSGEAGDCLEKVSDCLKKVMLSSRHLVGLINDVLDMSRIESGRMTLGDSDFLLSDMLEEVSSVISSQAQTKEICFHIERERVTHEALRGDIVRLSQVLVNILGNAVKFTDAGGCVTLRVEEGEMRGETVRYRFVCRDTGQGMDPSFLPHLFEPFAQERRQAHETYVGTGLGMSITKSIVDLMHGTIEVESSLNLGTVITVEVPLTLAKEAPRKSSLTAKEHSVFAGRRVLVAEDIAVNAEVVCLMIGMHGGTAEAAGDGQACVELFESHEPGYYDLILMDIRMPRMDGREAARRIRSMDRSDAATIPIIAMSADAFSDDVEASLSCGMNHHLSKPVSFEMLEKTAAIYLD